MRVKYDFIESNFMYLKKLFMFQLVQVFPIFTETNNIEAHNTSHRDRRKDRNRIKKVYSGRFSRRNYRRYPCLLTNARFPHMRSALGGRKTQNRAVSISNNIDLSQL